MQQYYLKLICYFWNVKREKHEGYFLRVFHLSLKDGKNVRWALKAEEELSLQNLWKKEFSKKVY